MPKAQIVFNLLSYWHVGSGTGDGASVDALVVKTAAGLPYIPGRTVKGLLREGVQLAEDCQKVPVGTTLQLFGGGSHEDRFGTVPGELFFTNADLGLAMEDWAAKTENHGSRNQLYRQLASTRIDKRGQAEDQSLRRIEVSIPMQLEAEVETASNLEWVKILQAGATMVRQIGLQRHRGLGRAQIQIKEVTA